MSTLLIWWHVIIGKTWPQSTLGKGRFLYFLINVIFHLICLKKLVIFLRFYSTFVIRYTFMNLSTWKLQKEDRIKGYLWRLKLSTILIQLLTNRAQVHLDFCKVFSTILFWNITAAVSPRQKYVRHTKLGYEKQSLNA